MADRPFDDDALTALAARIDAWLAAELDDNPMLAAVEHDPALRRWYVRLHGEDKEFTTIWFTLGQRTLEYETYVMPAPVTNQAEVWTQLLRRNHGLTGMAFSIGDEDAVYLVGRLPLDAVDEGELDRIVGSTWAYVEQAFRPAMRLGYEGIYRG